MFGSSPREKAFFAPFLWFVALQGLGFLVSWAFAGQAGWYFTHPQYWVQPAQTLLCGRLVFRNWHHYEMGPLRRLSAWVWSLGIGLAVILLWIAPQAWLGFPARTEGFDPAFFGPNGWPYFANLSMRMARLVLVVPLVEEVFWRGFLMRWLIDEDFTKVPIGAFQWKAFSLVAIFFMLEHQQADYPAALLTGALFNLVAMRTAQLSACVLAHALANLLLGLYILRTAQYGFW